MKIENTLIVNFCDSLRQHRWLIVATFAAMLTGLELARYNISTLYEFDRAYRLLLFGIALPLLAGIAFSIPSGLKKNQALAGRTKNQARRRVLVSTNEMLLGAGIESLLMHQEELNLVRVASGSDVDLIKKIGRLKPEVVILDEVMYRASARQMLAFLDDWPEIRLIVVNTSDNRVQVYNKRQILVTQSTDLIEMMYQTQSG